MSNENLQTHPPPYCANVNMIQPSAPSLYQQCNHQTLGNMTLDDNVNTGARHHCHCIKDLNMDMKINMTFNCGACSSETNHTHQRNEVLVYNTPPLRNEAIQQHRHFSQQVHFPPQDYLPQNRNYCNRVEIHPTINKGNMPNDNYEFDNGPLTIHDLDTNHPCSTLKEPEVDYNNQEHYRRQNNANTKIGLRRIDINSLDDGYEKRKEWMAWRTDINEELLTMMSEARKNRQVCFKSHYHNQPIGISATSVGAVVDHAFCRPRGLPMSCLEWKHFILFGIPRAHLQL